MSDPSLITLHVKHGAETVELSVAADAWVGALQEALEQRTSVMIRKQKLIFKGKVLTAKQKLKDTGIGQGAKLMLLAADGVQTQGQAAAQTQKKQKQDEAAERVKLMLAQARGLAAPGASSSSALASTSGRAPAIDWAERRKTWQKIGILGLRDLGLCALPSEAFESLEEVKVADLCLNQLTELPSSTSCLVALHTLKLASNALSLEGIPWPALVRMTCLRVLALDSNRLTSLPDEVGQLISLQQLTLAGNQVTQLPAALSALTSLELLVADDNKLEALPAELGHCCSLVELSAERNRISALPEELSSLKALQTIKADSNMIRAVPPCVLEACFSLAILSLQANPITADQLRSTQGFAAYDARRVAKCNKQLDMDVLPAVSRAFTEGADQQQWSRWAGYDAKPR